MTSVLTDLAPRKLSFSSNRKHNEPQPAAKHFSDVLVHLNTTTALQNNPLTVPVHSLRPIANILRLSIHDVYANPHACTLRLASILDAAARSMAVERSSRMSIIIESATEAWQPAKSDKELFAKVQKMFKGCVDDRTPLRLNDSIAITDQEKVSLVHTNAERKYSKIPVLNRLLLRRYSLIINWALNRIHVNRTKGNLIDHVMATIRAAHRPCAPGHDGFTHTSFQSLPDPILVRYASALSNCMLSDTIPTAIRSAFLITIAKRGQRSHKSAQARRHRLANDYH